MMRHEIGLQNEPIKPRSRRENTPDYETITATEANQNNFLENAASSFLMDLSLVRLLALLKVRIAYCAEVPCTRTCNDISTQQMKNA